MPFEAFFDEMDNTLKTNTKVLFPISLGQKYHTGERLKALLNLAKGYNSTFLIADGLHQHNLGSLQKALAFGEKFLEKNEETFKNTTFIESVEDWEKHKENASVIKVVRWGVWAKIKQAALKEADQLVEEECKKPTSSLKKAMQDVAQHNLSTKTLESSIKYQTEENKYLLCFTEFDYHIYPAPLNASQAEMYQLFDKQFKMPIHKQVKFRSILLSTDNTPLQKQQRHAQSLPLTARMLINNIEELLVSTEVSTKHKELFIIKLQSILTSAKHQLENIDNNQSNVDEKFSTKENIVSFTFFSPDVSKKQEGVLTTNIAPTSLLLTAEEVTI